MAAPFKHGAAAAEICARLGICSIVPVRAGGTSVGATKRIGHRRVPSWGYRAGAADKAEPDNMFEHILTTASYVQYS